MRLLVLAFLTLTACATSYTGWTRAEAHTDAKAQQLALEHDRKDCNDKLAKQTMLYQMLLTGVDLEMCLEHKGWRRVR